MVKVSIVVPVYNVEKYLVQCLDSLVNQTLREIEFICVNDGSTDSSAKILEAYALKDERINIIDQNNLGLSVARNVGMAQANGEYIGFVDSDDWIDERMYEKLYNEAKCKNTNMSFCAAHRYNETDGSIRDDDYLDLTALPTDLDNQVFNIKAINQFAVLCTAWNKIYRTDFLCDTKITFPAGLIFEDNIFWHQTLIKAQRISFLRDKLYFYRRDVPNSVTDQFDSRYFDIIPVSNLVIDAYKQAGLFDVYKEQLLEFKFSNIQSRLLMNDVPLDRKQYQVVQKDLRKVKLDSFGRSNLLSLWIISIRQNYCGYFLYIQFMKIKPLSLRVKEFLINIIGTKNKSALKKIFNI